MEEAREGDKGREAKSVAKSMRTERSSLRAENRQWTASGGARGGHSKETAEMAQVNYTELARRSKSTRPNLKDRASSSLRTERAGAFVETLQKFILLTTRTRAILLLSRKDLSSCNTICGAFCASVDASARVDELHRIRCLRVAECLRPGPVASCERVNE
eukprot:3011271-Pleurochrysis_carterae.AAC.1